MSNLILKVFLFAGLDEVSTKIKGLSSFILKLINNSLRKYKGN